VQDRRRTVPTSASATPPWLVKDQEAKALIKDLKLEAILAAAEATIAELCANGAPILQVEIQRYHDPELPDRLLLAVTVWLGEESSDQASNLWRELLKGVNQRVEKISPADLEKFAKYVSIGVDVE
jgi:hypothetical protein